MGSIVAVVSNFVKKESACVKRKENSYAPERKVQELFSSPDVGSFV